MSRILLIPRAEFSEGKYCRPGWSFWPSQARWSLVTLVDNEAIRALNRQYRQIDAATDVLSFAQEEGEAFEQPAGAPRLLGDIVISLERAREQSEAFNHSLAREVGYLIAHGLLHLLGYDHQNIEDKEKMRSVEEQIMARVNLARD